MNDFPGTINTDPLPELVLSTDKWKTRRSRLPDYETENHALLAIAQHMADSPRTTLQKLAEVILQACRAGSTAVSLVSKENGNSYWSAVAGVWTPDISGMMSRHFAPHSVVLNQNTAQLFMRPEQQDPLIPSALPPIAEALLTPFYVAGKAIGTVWVIAHETDRKFDAEDLRQIESLSQLAAAAFPLSAALEVDEQQSKSMRDINEALLVSSVRQHELTEQAQKAEKTLRASEEQLSVELAATQQLQEASTQLIREDNAETLYEQILNTAVAIMRSEFACIQILYPERGSGGELRLLGYRGFNPQAAQDWEWVPLISESIYAIALRTGQRIVIADVQTSDLIVGTQHDATFLHTGIRSVQTTPLISRNRKLVGLISTHWRQPHLPSERDLRLLDVLARLASDLIERSQAKRHCRTSTPT